MAEVRNVNKGVKLTTTSATNLYSAPNHVRSRVGTMAFINTGGSDSTFTLDWVDKADSSSTSSTQVYKIFKDKSVKAGKSVILDLNLVLEKQDILRATASAANVFEVSLSIEEKSIQQ